MDRIQARLDEVKLLQSIPILAPAWPSEGQPLTFEAALEAMGQGERTDACRKILHAMHALHGMAQCPILAVLGGLNAGKSSVVASFLSDVGRRRIPCGVAGRQGTHRFVYWVPESWRNATSIRDAFFELLTAVHGPEREYLSSDPAEAERQYGSGRDNNAVLRTPLIATDPHLDTLRTALLDCPDVQTRDRDAPDGASRLDNLRLDFLMNAARICSAFLIVWLRLQVRDRLLETILKGLRERAMKSPRYLLLNCIVPEAGQPTRTRNDCEVVRILTDYAIDDQACYGAFNFKIPGWEDLTPLPLVRGQDPDTPVPQFFGLSTSAAENMPTTVSENRYLIGLPRQLNAADLQQQKLQDNWNQLASRILQDLDDIQAWAASRHARAREIHQGLLDFCVRKFTDPRTGEPLQVVSKELAYELQVSFVRTAPTLVRWPLQWAQPFEKAVQAIGETLGRLNFRRRTHALQDDLKRNLHNLLGIEGLRISDPRGLAEEMKPLRFVPAAAAVEQLEQAWDSILTAFARHPLRTDAADELNQLTGKLWEHMPLQKKLRVAGMSLLKSLGSIAALAGTLTVLVDGGATLLAAYSLAQTLANAVPGLAALAGGAAGAVAAWAGFVAGVLKWNTLPSLSRFFAFSCDAFGVPRRFDQSPIMVKFGNNPLHYTLPEPHVPKQSTVYSLEDLRLWQQTEGFEKWQLVLHHG
jgi:hypothetical protein